MSKAQKSQSPTIKVLVSGFKPFLGEVINPTEKIVNQLQKDFTEKNKFVTEELSGCELKTLILPVEFNASWTLLESEIDTFKPDYIILTGQALGRDAVCVEKIGLNLYQTTVADEAGFCPEVGAIQPEEPLALKTSWLVDLHVEYLKKHDLKTQVSLSAGGYVCNFLYFQTLNAFKNIPAVFIHFPILPEQLKSESSVVDSTPTMTESDMQKALQLTLKFIKLIHV